MPDLLIQSQNALTGLLVIVLLTLAFGWSSYGCLPPEDNDDP
jgi:hypothetical protein